MSHPREQSGFTLVEMLIVVAILAVLIGILLPSVHRARGTARSAVCLSNLRQMTTAAHVYANRNRNCYPLAYYFDGARMVSWDYTMDFSGGGPAVNPGLLWGGMSPGEVQQCPSFDGASNSFGDPYTGYNYNTSYVGGFRDFGASEFVPSARLTGIGSPSRTACFGDGEWADGANKYMRAPLSHGHDPGFSGRHAGTQGYRHLGRTNVAFADGHAATHPDRHRSENDAAGARLTRDTGFLSEDNRLYDLE